MMHGIGYRKSIINYKIEMSSLKLFGNRTLYEILGLPLNSEIIDGTTYDFDIIHQA